MQDVLAVAIGLVTRSGCCKETRPIAIAVLDLVACLQQPSYLTGRITVYNTCIPCYAPHMQNLLIHFMRLHFIINDRGPPPATHAHKHRPETIERSHSFFHDHARTIDNSATQGWPAIMPEPPTQTDTPSTMSRKLLDVAPAVAKSQPAMASDHMEEATEPRGPVNAVFNIVSCTRCRSCGPC